MQGVESHQSPKEGYASEVLGGKEKTGLKTAAAWISAHSQTELKMESQKWKH